MHTISTYFWAVNLPLSKVKYKTSYLFYIVCGVITALMQIFSKSRIGCAENLRVCSVIHAKFTKKRGIGVFQVRYYKTSTTKIIAMDLLTKNIEPKKAVKGTLLQQKDDTVFKGYYVEKGLLRTYTIDSSGKEHTFMFAPEGWFIADFGMLFPPKKAALFVEALEDSELLVMSEDLFTYMHLLPEDILAQQINRFMRRNSVLQNRVLMLMGATAQERYLDFLEMYPNLINRMPLKMIASYLGITAEALSRVRRALKEGRP